MRFLECSLIETGAEDYRLAVEFVGVEWVLLCGVGSVQYVEVLAGFCGLTLEESEMPATVKLTI
jgi:hypothetical protein